MATPEQRVGYGGDIRAAGKLSDGGQASCPILENRSAVLQNKEKGVHPRADRQVFWSVKA